MKYLALLLVLLSPAAFAQGFDVWWTSNGNNFASNDTCPPQGSNPSLSPGDQCFVTGGSAPGGTLQLSRHVYLCFEGACGWYTQQIQDGNGYVSPPSAIEWEGSEIPLPLWIMEFQFSPPDPWNPITDPWCLGFYCGPNRESGSTGSQ